MPPHCCKKDFFSNFGVVWVLEWVEVRVSKPKLRLISGHKTNLVFEII